MNKDEDQLAQHNADSVSFQMVYIMMLFYQHGGNENAWECPQLSSTHHVYICDCEQPEHNAGLILVAISCLLDSATQFLDVLL